MNFSFILDYWLDTTAAALGVVATLVGIYTAFRLLDRRQPMLEMAGGPSFSAVVPEEKAMAFSVVKPKTPAPQSLSREVLPTAASQSGLHPSHQAQTQLAELMPPELSADGLRSLGEDRLRLTLRNAGQTLAFQRFEPGEFNEMEVNYTPPVYREKETFARGSALNFTLQSSQLERATYHFFVVFKDEAGHTYRQEVAGMGAENPIIERPVRA
jgi:hypothetical protein